jgi:hypothetical protein
VSAAKPVALDAVPPDGDQEYVYGAVPPEAVTEAEPSLAPLALVATEEVVALNAAAGWLKVRVLVEVQPLASVAVTV